MDAKRATRPPWRDSEFDLDPTAISNNDSPDSHESSGLNFSALRKFEARCTICLDERVFSLHASAMKTKRDSFLRSVGGSAMAAMRNHYQKGVTVFTQVLGQIKTEIDSLTSGERHQITTTSRGSRFSGGLRVLWGESWCQKALLSRDNSATLSVVRRVQACSTSFYRI